MADCRHLPGPFGSLSATGERCDSGRRLPEPSARPVATAPAFEADSTVIMAPINVSRPSKSVKLPDNSLPCVCREEPRLLCRRDYFNVALLVGNLNSHGIIPAFEK